jgi:hypothetical protein
MQRTANIKVCDIGITLFQECKQNASKLGAEIEAKIVM